MSTIQHEEARKLLPIVTSAAATHRLLTYRTAAQLLGRDPHKNSRMVAQVCDLLDAAAALGGVPLLALVTVRELSGDINRKAWTGDEWSVAHREAIINRSVHHQFSDADFQAISEALTRLDGKSNRVAWEFVRQAVPDVYLRLAEPPKSAEYLDAIDDIGTDTPNRVNTSGLTYARDPRIREAVKRRAGGTCEFCGELGFKCSNGERYVECHHIIALADQGADRMTNVIALCPNHHREAHFGERQAALEKEMIQKVMILEGKGTATV